MVSIKKKQTVKKYTELIGKYSVVGLLNMHKLPGRQLHNIRNTIRNDAKILMVKKRLLKLIFEEMKRDNMNTLLDFMQGQPALLLSNSDPFKIARTLDASKAPAKAKNGDIAQKDIVVPAGPTPLPPGPAIGDLQKIKLPAMVQGDKIAIRADTVVTRQGEVISGDVANVLMKLGIEPMEVGLNMVAAWDSGLVFPRDLLFIPISQYEDNVKMANLNAFNLTMFIGYVTPHNITFLVSKCAREANGLAMAGWIYSPSTMDKLIGKAHRQAVAVQAKMPQVLETQAEPASGTDTVQAPSGE